MGKSEEINDRLPPSGVPTLVKPASEINLATKFNELKVQSFKKVKKTHKRSFSLTKGIFSSDKSAPSDSHASSAYENSPDSSPSPGHSSLHKSILSYRRSVDNLPMTSASSSPVSTRSASAKEKRKKKTRPSSVVLLGRKSLDSVDNKNKTASMDSLARQSLLAAQVLHLIPANKARERNFLHGRIAANSLLGNLELERVLPNRELRIYVATWNMNGQAPPTGLNPLLLPEGLENVPDIVAVGTQESYPERFQWEITLQETLGPSHVLFHSAAFGTIHLAIYLRRDLIWFCSIPDEANYSVRPGTAFRTKGALGIAFYLFGTSFLFLTCHLTAHQDKVKERLQDIRKIVKALELPNRLPIRKKGKDLTDNFDYVLWCGDLNFRLTRPRSEVLDWISKQSFPLREPAQCTPGDQLTDNIKDGSILNGFQEGPLTFAPTYKYDTGSHNFDTSNKQRTPSYTDRILYKSKRSGPEHTIECLAYSSVPSVCTSDHKPVWGLYKCQIRPGIDTIPLNAGLFNREVYLEAIKRRAAAMDQRDGASTVCSVQ